MLPFCGFWKLSTLLSWLCESWSKRAPLLASWKGPNSRVHHFLYCLRISPKKALRAQHGFWVQTLCQAKGWAGSMNCSLRLPAHSSRPDLVAQLLLPVLPSDSYWQLLPFLAWRGKMQASGLGVGVEIDNSSSSVYLGSGTERKRSSSWSLAPFTQF